MAMPTVMRLRRTILLTVNYGHDFELAGLGVFPWRYFCGFYLRCDKKVSAVGCLFWSNAGMVNFGSKSGRQRPARRLYWYMAVSKPVFRLRTAALVEASSNGPTGSAFHCH